MSSVRDCPCCSGLSYATCCAPFHNGEREAPDPETLMRSRYAAYAKKLAPYIYRTLHPEHDDRKRDESIVMREIRDATSRLRFMRLAILDRSGPDETGIARVLFYARVFETGQNRSFVELSDFVHHNGAWRYLNGKPMLASPAAALERFDIAAFDVLASASRTNGA